MFSSGAIILDPPPPHHSLPLHSIRPAGDGNDNLSEEHFRHWKSVAKVPFLLSVTHPLIAAPPPPSPVPLQSHLDGAVLHSVKKRRGSMSAEHGIGQQKAHILHEIRSQEEIAVMKMLKTSFDPKNLLNPNKILPPPPPPLPHLTDHSNSN
jgi:FAD/FMN-containing dehydrogenase